MYTINFNVFSDTNKVVNVVAVNQFDEKMITDTAVSFSVIGIGYAD